MSEERMAGGKHKVYPYEFASPITDYRSLSSQSIPRQQYKAW